MRIGRYWHPFADMEAVAQAGELVIDRADGYYIWDDQDRRYLDATASLWYCNVGHGRQEIVDAVARQMARLEAYSTFGDLTNQPVVDLAERVSALAPIDDALLFLTSGGSDSIDTAVKLARRYFHVTGQPQRRYVIGRQRGYHGMHVAGTSIGGIAANVDGYGELLHDVGVVEWDSHEHLASTIDELGAENVAAFVCEPVIGAGGVLAPPPSYLEKARVTCRDAGVLFVADEVVTGFGRTGYWFASERFDLDPDMITCAKGITSGYLPLGAVVVSPEIAEPWYSGGAGMWRHGYTYSGHASVAAAALANLDILERDGLLANARRLERRLEEGLGPLTSHQLVSEVRAGVGALAAIQLEPAACEAHPGLPARVLAACRQSGIMTRMLVGNALHVSPPLMLDDAGVTELAEGFRAALDLVAA
jgi:adenosylmethionine-8-amino-7-oxononanoate aminotransferase